MTERARYAAKGRDATGRASLRLLLALYGLEASAAVLALALYKKGDSPLEVFLARPAGTYLLLACAGLLLFGVLAAWAGRRVGSKAFAFVSLLNAIPVLGVLCGGELLVRIAASPGPEGLPAVLGTTLLPRRWADMVERNRALLAQASEGGAWVSSFLVYDDLLGWRLGPDRHSQGRSAFSSLEGIRSPHAGVRYADTSPRHRVALVGDSKTFGLDVSFEDSWGGRLQQRLGSLAQVLNFGVDAYGIDQAFLRYRRDVRPWKPDVVLFGVVEHDFRRSEAVYTFVSFPHMQLPFARPRFVPENGRLRLLNVPVPDPRELLEVESVAALPLIELDSGHVAREWDWRPYHASYLLRFVISRFPRFQAPESPGRQAERLALNGAILRAFVEMAQSEGSKPILLYLPGPADFGDLAEPPGGDGTDLVDADRLARRAVRETVKNAGGEFVDLRRCLLSVAPDKRFLPDNSHHSPEAGAALAKCLAPLVRARLTAAES